MFGLPFDIIGISYDKYLVSIGVVEPAMYASVVFNVVMVFLCYYFIIVLELDYWFIAWASVAASLTRTVTEVVISLRHKQVVLTLTYPTVEVFYEWKEFFSLGIPGCVMICAEWYVQC